MARYTIRIELLDATWDEYEAMYELLAKVGIVDSIADSTGATYRLPPAEYNYDGTATRAQVVDMAKSAASAVVGKYRVFVTESAGRAWHNLEGL